MSERKWLNCRLADLEEQLNPQGHPVSRPVISRLLRAHDYPLHVNVNDVEGVAPPDRDTQFRYIQAQRTPHQAAGQPCLSVDTKKKELIGNSKNGGQSWGTQAERVKVQVPAVRHRLHPALARRSLHGLGRGRLPHLVVRRRARPARRLEYGRVLVPSDFLT